ncbi:MAG TPA: type I DNA topoisomerase [Alphaproteobacteria bacterium]|jgi:DNA topoisomerase-1
MSNVVVVESPAKAKTINKYLGSDYTVLASYGHVRDLPAKDGSVRPDESFAMSWEVADRGAARVNDIAKALKNADTLILATDPDREGEAISWHVLELLKDRGLTKGKTVQRVVFHEITKSAILEAMKHPRDLDRPLIDAYLARRALDYLVGFTLSPVLWRKLPGSRSAGRVQSVALRLICERESEIEIFKAREYWSVDADFKTPDGSAFTAHLTHLDGKRLDKFDLNDEASAKRAAGIIESRDFAVSAVERKQARRNPAPPFTTSTLQQEASRKLGFSARQTMQLAQRLYEGTDIGGETVGLISYMRTDSVTLSGDALGQARRVIGKDFGEQYLPATARVYKSNTKNAQEAHEAIRPTDLGRAPNQVARYIESDQLRLYELIWKRTLASQMASAELDQVAVDIASGDATLRATGSVVTFDGFLKLYREDRDDAVEGDDENSKLLPKMDKGDRLARQAVRPEQHFTQPPPRFSEASLVKKLEELGIGRPSTYASIISVLQDRDYVKLDKKRFVPEDRGRMVTTFLDSFFRDYIQYDFTANLEDQLDGISDGKIDWKKVLGDFWKNFSRDVAGTKDLTITQVIDALDAALGPHFFPDEDGGKNPRACPTCGNGRLGLKLGKFGAFIGCSNYPECKFTRKLSVEKIEEGSPMAALAAGPLKLGDDPTTGKSVTVRKGPYGLYIQLGEMPEKPVAEKDADEKPAKGKKKPKAAKIDPADKPKRVGVPKGMDVSAITMEQALSLLSLPRTVGTHPEDGKVVKAGIGRFGPYIQHDKVYASIPPDEDVLSVGLNRAVDLLAEKVKRGGRGDAALREIGLHPSDEKPITLHKGRYGLYVKHGKINATLPGDADPETFGLDASIALLAARAAKAGVKVPKGKAKAKAADADAAPKKKAPAKKAAAKKPAAKKAAKKAPAKKGAKKAAPKTADETDETDADSATVDAE